MNRAALAAITLAGAALRFATLGVQSYWLDEAATVQLLRKGFGSMLSGVVRGESTPPLYYGVAWVWAKLFGTGEVGLRSLSAVIGTATIPVAYVLGRRIAGATTGLVAAALAAFSPLLVWYSQEARSYALMLLLAGLGLVAFLAALEQPSTRRLGWWAAASVAAVATHYYAGFLVGAEAGWLLVRFGTQRRVLVAGAAVLAAACALLPLAIHQRSNGGAAFIGQTSLAHRLAEVPKQFALGYHGPLEVALTVVVMLALVGAWARLLAWTAPGARRAALLLAGIAVAAIGAAAFFALAGADYLLTRNELATWLPLAAASAAGFAAAGRARSLGIAAAVLVCALGLASVVAVAADRAYQRDDWRGAAHALGRASGPRVVFVSPPSGVVPLELYRSGLRPVPSVGVNVKEIDAVAMAPRLPGQKPRPPRPGTVAIGGYTEAGRSEAETYTVVRERSATGGLVGPGLAPNPLTGSPAVPLYEP